MKASKLIKFLSVIITTCLLMLSLPLVANAANVSITKNGNIINATNGNYTITYDLSIGRGTIAYGSTVITNNFYSDIKLSNSSTRIYSYDNGGRTASWVSIGSDGYGVNGYKLTINCALSTGYTLTTNFYFYENSKFFLTDMNVTSTSNITIDFMEPIATNTLNIGNFSDERILSTPYTNNDDFGVCPVNNFGTFNGTSNWVCSIFDNTNLTGFVAGAATTAKWKSSQYLAAASTANGPLNGFSVYNNGGTQSGTLVNSDKFFLGYYTDYRIGLEEYGSKYAVGEAPMIWNGDVPIGYNNWYALRAKDPLTTMYNIVDYVDKNLKSFGYKYVNLDATSLTNSEKQTFANYCHSKGLKAGGYTCPFIVWESMMNSIIPGTSYYYRDAILKDSNNNKLTWYLGTGAYVLDATHPAGIAAITQFIQDFIDEGFDFIKLDFIDYGMQEGSHYDSTKNGMQSFRSGMALIKQLVNAANRPIFLSESIAPLLPNSYAHSRRTGCDTEIGIGNKGYAGYERQAFNAVASWFTNGTIWKHNDADMAMVDNYVGSEYWLNSLSQNHARLLNSYIATGGGLWLASDNLPLVPAEKMNGILKNSSILEVVKMGKAGRPVKMTNFLHLSESCPAITYVTAINGDRIVAVSNWSKTNAASIDINWSDIGLNSASSYYVVDLYRNENLGRFTSKYITSFKGAAHDSLLLRVSSTVPVQPSSAANLAQGKTFTASSFYSTGYEASKAGDGGWSTRWSAASTNNQWLEVNLGSNKTVNSVILKEYKASEVFGNNYTINDFSVQYYNGSSYVNIAKDSKIGFEKVVNFPSISTSKLRITFTGSSFLPSIREFEAYNINSNTGPAISLDSSDAAFSTYSDIRQNIQRMQVFKAQAATFPRFDYFGYKTGNPGPLSVSVYSLDASYNPVNRLFEANVVPDNFPTSLMRMPVYCNLTGLTAGSYYGIIIKSPTSPNTSNCYGFGYSDSNPLANSFERVSTNGGTTWTTENSGNRDLKITIYK